MVKKKEKQDIHFKRNLKVYFELARRYKWMYLGVLIIVLIGSLTRIADKYLFKVLIDEGTAFSEGTLLRESFVQILIVVAIVYLSVILTRTITNWLKHHLTNRVGNNIMADLKNKYFKHIIYLDHNFHTTNKTGSLISRLTRGSWALDGLNDFFIFNLAPLILQAGIAFAAVIYFDVASAIVILIMSFSFVIYSWYLINKQKRSRIVANNAEDLEKANIGDVFTNIDSIKYYGKEDRMYKNFSKLVKDTRDKSRKNWDYFRWIDAGQTLIVGIGLFFLVYFPLMKFLNGEITLGTLAFLYTVFGTITEPLYGFMWGIRGYYESMANLESLFEYDKYKNKIKDHPLAKKLKINRGEILFKDMSFAYPNKKSRAVRRLNLHIKPNQKIAFVGHSGCGKTTIVKLLYRFYDPLMGNLYIDGKNIKNFKQESLREELSIVPQEAILFDDTIYNNILFSKPDATKSEVFRAMRFAQLDKLVNKLPKKDKTIVGERGVKLSGGEKQRVSIARAILANKKVLVLDEATSALDSKTEYEIQRDLNKLMQGRTSIIIAHRLSTIMHADKIVVLDEGRIVQIGKHRDLIKKRGPYKELWNLQKGGYIKE